LLALAGCGGSSGGGGTSAGGGGASASCQGTLLTDAQLCKLTCNSTTRDQAIALLGAPDSSVDSNMISYMYTCVTTTGGDVLQLHLHLFFDSDSGALTTVRRTGLGAYASGTLPSCLGTCIN
jgi:hypothetical protein